MLSFLFAYQTRPDHNPNLNHCISTKNKAQSQHYCCGVDGGGVVVHVAGFYYLLGVHQKSGGKFSSMEYILVWSWTIQYNMTIHSVECVCGQWTAVAR